MSRTPVAYLNYLHHQVYVNASSDEDKTAYVGQTYDITTDLQAIKNYLGIDSTLQVNAFESYGDLTDYYLTIDDSQFIKDQTTIEVTDIYFSDISDTTRFDNSVLLFSIDDLITGYSTQDASTILHFKFEIKAYPDITDHLVYSFPIFLSPNMSQIANDLIVQFDINFVNITLFNDHALLMALKDYIETNYVMSLNSDMSLNFVGWNNIYLIDYREMLNDMILSSLSKALGKEWEEIRDDMVKWYISTPTEMMRLAGKTDANKLIDLFITPILDFYTNHVDWTIDPYAGFSTDKDIYEVYHDIHRFVYEGDYFRDRLDVNFTKFVLIRNNIYNWKFTLLHDDTEFWSDYIKFKVKNIIPDWTDDFTFSQNGFNIDVTSHHHTDIPLKIDILEYSNNLVWCSSTPYSRFINEYYFDDFTLKFTGNKLNLDYGYNAIRIFLSDSLSEVYKDIKYGFIYAPFEVISEKIAKVQFYTDYLNVENTWNVEKLLPLNEDFETYEDLTARFDPNSDDWWMWIKIPVDYELIYLKNVPLTVEFDITDATGGTLPQFEYLIQDTTKVELTLAPTLEIEEQGQIGKSFVVMMRYKFDRNVLYTDSLIQQLNGMLHVKLTNTGVDATDDNYFAEYLNVQFVTTRFKLRKSSHTPVAAQAYTEKDEVSFIPSFSTVSMFSVYTAPEYDSTLSKPCNFGVGLCKATDMTVKKNRTTTVKSIPITIDAVGSYGITVADGKSIDTAKSKDGTNVMVWVSPIVGAIKQIENFTRDGIYRIVINKFMQWIVDDMINWYMENVENDIQLTYRIDYDRSPLRTLKKAEFIDPLLRSDSSCDGWGLIKYAFDYYGLDHTSASAYSDADLGFIRNKFAEIDQGYGGGETFWSYELDQKYAFQIDVNFGRSEIYNLGKLEHFVKESFIKQYYPEVLPSGWKFSKYGDNGQINSKGRYDYGDMFRSISFGGERSRDRSNVQDEFLRTSGLQSSINFITEYFCNNYHIDFTTGGSLLSLTPYEAINLYFDNSSDAEGVRTGLLNGIYNMLRAALGGSIKVKRIYSADLTATLDSITDDLFALQIEPTSLSPLYSSFRITDVKCVYDTNVVTVTELFDKKSLISQRTNVNDIFGTGMKIQYKYLNHSINTVPLSVLIYYIDEFNYEKTISVELELRSKIQTTGASELSNVIQCGVNVLKSLQMMQIFDSNSDVVQTCVDAMNSVIGDVLNNTVDDNIGDGAKQFWGGIFEAEKQFKSVFKKYLPTDVLNAFYYDYVENLTYGRPTFGFSTGVSMFMLPENVENMEANNPQRRIASDAVSWLLDSQYKANEGWNAPYGGSVDPCVDYKKLISLYYSDYIDKRGYDINLVLLPDTTYNISFKTYLVFTWNMSAAENAMGVLSGFLASVGGGTENDYMSNLCQFLTLARVYPNIEDLLRGILRDLWIPLNFERYGRVPSAMNPITVREYYPNQFEADYNTFIESATAYYAEFEKSNKAHVGFVVPFEKIILSIDTTSTGFFDVNFLSYYRMLFKTQFVNTSEKMCYSNISVSNIPNSLRTYVHVPSVIPAKSIDITVRPLF